MRAFIALWALLSLLISCASPTVVTERQASDTSLSCSGLLAAIREAEEFEEEAREERGITGTNAAAVVFFWPGLIGTYANTEEAIDAAEDRQEYLSGLYEQKNCSAASNSGGGTSDLAGQLRELRGLFEVGLMTQEEYDAARARVLGLQ